MGCNRSSACGFVFLLASPFAASAQPRIDHSPLECIEPGRFAVVLSGIDPGLEIQTAKVYFRSSLYPDFYYVEMTRETDRFIGLLPQVSPETPRVVYYIEAVDSVFESVRSPEFDPLVEDCDDDPAGGYFTGAEPGIVVGATAAGSSALPPGFSAVGIIGTITAAGVSSGLGGGVGAGVAVAAAAGAAGAAGAVVAATGGSQTTTTAVVAAAPTTVTTTTAPAPGAPPPPTTTAPQSPTTSVPVTTTIPGAPTTTTVPSTSTSTSTTSTTSSTTSSTSTTTTTAPALNADCFTVQVLGDCKVRLDATCVSPPVDRYEWELDTGNRWQYVYIANGAAAFEHTFGNCDEEDENITFTLTVHRGGASSSASSTVNVPGNDLKETAAEAAVRLTISTLLELSSNETARARVSLDGAALAPILVDGHPVDLRSMVAPGEHSLSAMVTGGRGIPGILRFDFGSTEGLAPGSLRAFEGTVLVLEPESITFRLSGQPGERVRFDFELR